MRVLKIILYLLGLVASLVYLLNPTAGVFEIIPDNLPIIGNLDEVAATGILVACWRGLRRLREEGKAAGAPAPGDRQTF